MLGRPNSIYIDFYLLYSGFSKKVGNDIFVIYIMQNLLHNWVQSMLSNDFYAHRQLNLQEKALQQACLLGRFILVGYFALPWLVIKIVAVVVYCVLVNAFAMSRLDCLRPLKLAVK